MRPSPDVLPNFFILGAAKSGTTSLWAGLRKHPDVFMPLTKEPNYFAFPDGLPEPAGPGPPELICWWQHGQTITDAGTYGQLFAQAGDAARRGEASVRYLYYPEVPDRLWQAVPDARLIILLRHPADRLVSHYWMNRGFLLEPLPLAAALDQEAARRERGWEWDWSYRSVSSYAQQVARYLDAFGSGNVGIYFFEEFVNHPEAIFLDVCRHLGVAPRRVPGLSRPHNPGRRPGWNAPFRLRFWAGPLRRRLTRLFSERVVFGVLDLLLRRYQLPVPRLPRSVRRRLCEMVRPEVEELCRVLGPRCARVWGYQ